jgi:hypothetical protein
MLLEDDDGPAATSTCGFDGSWWSQTGICNFRSASFSNAVALPVSSQLCDIVDKASDYKDGGGNCSDGLCKRCSKLVWSFPAITPPGPPPIRFCDAR